MELIQTVKELLGDSCHFTYTTSVAPENTTADQKKLRYCNGPSLAPLESRNKIPSDANNTVITLHLHKQ